MKKLTMLTICAILFCSNSLNAQSETETPHWAIQATVGPSYSADLIYLDLSEWMVSCGCGPEFDVDLIYSSPFSINFSALKPISKRIEMGVETRLFCIRKQYTSPDEMYVCMDKMFGLSPSFRFYYMKRDIVKLYTNASLGFGILMTTVDDHTTSMDEIANSKKVGFWPFFLHYSPIGIQVGKKTFFAADLGIGSGSIGIGYRF